MYQGRRGRQQKHQGWERRERSKKNQAQGQLPEIEHSKYTENLESIAA